MPYNNYYIDNLFFTIISYLSGGVDVNVHLQRPGYGTQTIDDFYQV